MRVGCIAILVFAFLGVFAPARSDPDYVRKNRVQYIEQILQALRNTDRNTLNNTRNYIQVIDRNTCRSAFADLKTNCLLEAAKRNCNQRRGGSKARKQCRLVSDVIVTNKLGEKEFLDTQTKYHIMKNQKKYRQAIRDELRRRYAELVIEFGLSTFFRSSAGNLASGIDGYCQQSTHKRGLSWQYCVAAVAWFVGTSENGSAGSN